MPKPEQIDMNEVRFVAKQMGGYHLSGHFIIEVVNEILRRRAELEDLRAKAKEFENAKA